MRVLFDNIVMEPAQQFRGIIIKGNRINQLLLLLYMYPVNTLHAAVPCTQHLVLMNAAGSCPRSGSKMDRTKSNGC